MSALRDFEAKIFNRINPAIKFSVTRYVLAVGVFVAIVVFGISSALGLGIDQLPTINIPVVIVARFIRERRPRSSTNRSPRSSRTPSRPSAASPISTPRARRARASSASCSIRAPTRTPTPIRWLRRSPRRSSSFRPASTPRRSRPSIPIRRPSSNWALPLGASASTWWPIT